MSLFGEKVKCSQCGKKVEVVPSADAKLGDLLKHGWHKTALTCRACKTAFCPTCVFAATEGLVRASVRVEDGDSVDALGAGYVERQYQRDPELTGKKFVTHFLLFFVGERRAKCPSCNVEAVGFKDPYLLGQAPIPDLAGTSESSPRRVAPCAPAEHAEAGLPESMATVTHAGIPSFLSQSDTSLPSETKRAEELSVLADQILGPGRTLASQVMQKAEERNKDPLLQRLFVCGTGADVDGCLARADDTEWCAAFEDLDMTRIPLNSFCTTYFRHPQGTDSRLVSLTLALGCLAQANRAEPAGLLVSRLAPKFQEKVRRGPSHDTSPMPSDEWCLTAAGKTFLLDAAKVLMEDEIDRHEWALPILDAIAVDWPTDDALLFWRAAAAYNIWIGDKRDRRKKESAQRRMSDFLANEAYRTMDTDSVSMMRQFLEDVEAAVTEPPVPASGGRSQSSGSGAMSEPVAATETSESVGDPTSPVGHAEAGFQMEIEDVFGIPGRGTVVTGRVARGIVRVNDPLAIFRGDGTELHTECKGIEVLAKQVTETREGDNVGLVLDRVSMNDVQAGDVILSAKVATRSAQVNTIISDAPRESAGAVRPTEPAETTFEFVVDDLFHIAGRGTVVAGRVAKGAVRLNDPLVLLKADGREVHTACKELKAGLEQITQAIEGKDVGMVLEGLSANDIQAGDMIVSLSPTARKAHDPSSRPARTLTDAEDQQIVEVLRRHGIEGVSTEGRRELWKHVLNGKKLDAVCLLRRHCPASGGLKEAKEAVEMLGREHGVQWEPLGSCFIATAAYGNAHAEDVVVLRLFREAVLRPSRLGRTLIRLYETCSPPVAQMIAKWGVLRTLTRGLVIRPAAFMASMWTRTKRVSNRR